MKWNIIYKHIIYKEIAYQLVLYIKVLRVDIYNTLIVITFISYAQSQTIGLAWVMMFNATLTIFQLPVYRGCQFYWWRKPEYQEKTTDQSQSLTNLIQ